MVAPAMKNDTSLAGLASLVAVMFFLVTVVIVLRFVARNKQRANFGIDDWLMIPTWLWFTGLAIASTYSMAKRFAGYYAPPTAALLLIHPTMLKIYWTIDLLSILCFGFVKLSVLFFYRRVFCTSNRGFFSMLTWIMIGIVTAWLVTFIVVTFMMCKGNMDVMFNTSNTAVCTVIFPYFSSSTISDFLLDVIILFMPIPKIWTLHTNTRKKLAVSLVFVLALAGLGASTTRMVITNHLVSVGKAVDDEDAFQSNTQVQYYIILEAGLTIVAANLPSLWYFLSGVTPERVLRSIRSIASLGSSTKSKSSRTEVNDHEKPITSESISSTSRDARSSHSAHHNDDAYSSVAYPEGHHVETHALSDLAPSRSVAGPGINVSQSITRSEQRI